MVSGTFFSLGGGFTMKVRMATMASLALVLLAGYGFAAEVKSGPQAGEQLPGPFHPLNINGSAAGNKQCLV
jgi:hypothetical protein